MAESLAVIIAENEEMARRGRKLVELADLIARHIEDRQELAGPSLEQMDIPEPLDLIELAADILEYYVPKTERLH